MVSPDYLFETSWEVCNKVGGIYTVISTKVVTLTRKFKDRYILIGPDIWRDEKENPEFTEDHELFSSWRSKANKEGLRVKTGRWNISGNPIVILVDFTPFISQKDGIFKTFWETHKLDSISGQWDYIEPALFGYAAAKIIESFRNFHLEYDDKIIAQFHEWMTGMGILYLDKNLPQVATIFTTHATVLGRALAGNNRPLYGNLEKFNPVQVAREFNIISKHSLEKISALTADAFTTVSEITSQECIQFFEKEVDLVTPNGFEDTFIPQGDAFHQKRAAARQKFLDVASALSGGKVSENALLVATSGRYEFKNKGIDLFINALVELSRKEDLGREIVAFILIPAHHYGPRNDLLQNLANPSGATRLEDPFLTHGLHHAEYDPTLKMIREGELENKVNDRVKVIFVPSYLNGNDGIFNLTYYDLLIGLDVTVFPSYYEPWGYTPLESLAFHVPTITTSLTGFGRWVNDHFNDPGNGILVVDRNDDNDQEVKEGIIRKLEIFSRFGTKEEEEARNRAFEISRIALWENLIDYYYRAYNLAIKKVFGRVDMSSIEVEVQPYPAMVKPQEAPGPVWRKIYVDSTLPEKLKKLGLLGKNFWWSWNSDVDEIFCSIDQILWEETGKNPVLFLETVNYQKLLVLEKDQDFLAKIDRVYERFEAYLDRSKHKKPPKVAYFSMEFGLHNSLKTYSGGLGILAGDYLKEASDSGADIIGIGLLYRYGYFKQLLSVNGEQQAVYEAESFSKIPVVPVQDNEGNMKTVQIGLPGRTLYARIWQVNVGTIPLYLLDTDFEFNQEQDRSITHHLYGGSRENRLKQEMLLGIGGIRALKTLGIVPDIYHSNEGHSAFIGLERLRVFIAEEKFTFTEALELVRGSTLFTTHTPVPAGHDEFEEDLLRTYISHYPGRLNITWDELMALGRSNTDAKNEKFNMSYLAANLSQEINGVSKLHGAVSREILCKLWPGYLPEELHIGHVTNGVHYPTWIAPEWDELFHKLVGESMVDQQSRREAWEKIHDVPDQEVWSIKQSLKARLISLIKERLRYNWIRRSENPRDIVEITKQLNSNALTFAFARRFATYKRASLLFTDLNRLEKIVNNPDRPVQILFAGKAHPNDGGGQELIKKIFEISKQPEFLGKVIFLQNYDLDLARYMVQGVDVWLNTPTRPLEASGTSGEKAVMNGTLHFSVLDGWWVEGYTENAGWALPQKRTYDNQDFQDELDAETIYYLLENEIIPAYYNRDNEGIPKEWVGFIKNTMAKVAPDFTMRRMLNDYQEKYYNRLFERKETLTAKQYQKTRLLAQWKQEIERKWDSLQVESLNFSSSLESAFQLGSDYSGTVIMQLNDLPASSIGLELIVAGNGKESSRKIVMKKEFKLDKVSDGKAWFSVRVKPTKPGGFTFGIRIFPKHELLPHRQDMKLVRWI